MLLLLQSDLTSPKPSPRKPRKEKFEVNSQLKVKKEPELKVKKEPEDQPSELGSKASPKSRKAELDFCPMQCRQCQVENRVLGRKPGAR